MEYITIVAVMALFHCLVFDQFLNAPNNHMKGDHYEDDTIIAEFSPDG